MDQSHTQKPPEDHPSAQKRPEQLAGAERLRLALQASGVNLDLLKDLSGSSREKPVAAAF